MAGKLCLCISFVLLVPLASSVLINEKKKNETFPDGTIVVRNCHEIQQYYEDPSGVYTIFPYDSNPDHPVQVYCDMDTDGGGWTVIQRRDEIQTQEDFYRSWMEYALGFGDLKGEFWLGLDHIHALTDQSLNEIRFDLADFEGVTKWAKYGFFYVYDRSESYKMEVNYYNGDAGDSFTYHNEMLFSAKDKDLDTHDDENCAIQYKGAWWYKNCHVSNLNGYYYGGQHESYADGIEWKSWHGQYYSLKKTEMKIRPAQ